MTNKKEVKVLGSVNPVIAAAAGVVVGAGVAVAGAIALKDEKNQKKIKEGLTNVKLEVKSYMENLQKQSQFNKAAVKEKVKQKATTTKVSRDQDAKEAKKVVATSIKRGL